MSGAAKSVAASPERNLRRSPKNGQTGKQKHPENSEAKCEARSAARHSHVQVSSPLDLTLQGSDLTHIQQVGFTRRDSSNEGSLSQSTVSFKVGKNQCRLM